MNLLRKISFAILLLTSLKGFSQGSGVDDSFNDNHNAWWEGESGGGSQHVRNGKLHIEFPDGGWTVSIAPYVKFEGDFKQEATFVQLDGENDHGLGLVWGYNKPSGEQNYLVISGNGYYYISNTTAEKGNEKKGVREWVKSDLIKPIGQPNVLKVEQKSGNLSFYINGEKVLTTPKFRWAGSEIGFVTWNKMTVEIDDYRFQQQTRPINLPENLTTGLVRENLGPNINTTADDLMPRITADGRTLYFGRENYEGNIGGVADGEDYYVSTYDGTAWGPAQNLGSPINTTEVNNVASISTDNNTVLFSDKTKFWSRSRSASGWGDLVEFGLSFVNEANYFESHLSADGKSILFTIKNSTNVAYNKGTEERDIYVSLQNDDGVWSPPLNLGPTVNTEGDEIAPFLAADGRTLYYSTTGKPGYGGTDMFMTKRIGDGWTNWSEPVNLGPEINTNSFDAYYVVPASGDYAYMVSNVGGFGKGDIVRIKLSKEIKPDPVVLIRGKTLDAKTKEPISANILIDNLNNNKEVGEAISDPQTGDFRIVLPYGFTYGFHAAAPGHLSVNENLELVQFSTYTEIEKNLYLVPIRVGETIQLNNVFFEQARPVLKPESFPELDRLVTIMKENPTMEIELGGYTDNVGREVMLVALSIDRVGTVKKYMVEKGIPSKRITGKGYGPANPVVRNDTEEHRRMNRRVEFKITKK